ncbi:hypothetical protein ACHQM5_013135 [Ranunculus cassubicifolius]
MNNDLHDVAITYFNQQEINFKANIFGTTFFNCEIWWNDHQGNKKMVSDFNLYDYKRDNYMCKHNDCFWNAREDGLYFLDVDDKVNPKLIITWNTVVPDKNKGKHYQPPLFSVPSGKPKVPSPGGGGKKGGGKHGK